MADDPELRYTKSNRWTWLLDKTAYVGGTVLQAFITTLVLSAGYMVFNDFIAPVPDITGRWKFTVYYENTANTRFQGLAVTYKTASMNRWSRPRHVMKPLTVKPLR
ncbi:MAG: hypothetical protein OXD39_13415 [Gemmatimonadetes bacterium]|nr:hypothetical protein [Gemmatimonadota bacterium]